MRRVVFLFLPGIFLTVFFLQCARKDAGDHKINDHPNIILFLVDDMGWQDSSEPFWKDTVANNRWFRTPNIVRLADEGMKFTNAYASSPVCSPTRTAILSGMNPAHSRITNWIPGEGNGPAEKQKFLVPDWRIDGLDHTFVSLPQLLNEAGYTTIHIGKAHFGRQGTEGADPHNLGFDISIAGNYRGQPGSYYVPYGDAKRDSQMTDLKKYFNDSLYLSDALTDEALRMIDTAVASGKPFFLNMAHYAVHTPIQGDRPQMEKYRNPGKNEFQVAYATMIESIDRSLGDILQKLQDLGIEKNTVLIFMSDNGGLVAHSGPPTTNYPLSSGKGSCREGGYREPMIVKWPGKVVPGSSCDLPVIAEDFFPTIVAMAGVKIPDTLVSKLDGTDLTPLLLQRGEITRPHPLVWHYPHYWANKHIRDADSTITPFSAIREGNWKLIYLYEKEQCELYNLAEDIGEQNNLTGDKPQLAKTMCTDLRNILQQMNAQTPVDRESGVQVPLPHY
ncbi:MAG: sulfatase [Chlorobi bacterium]|nr:sulfatase [Chlorobiota bacterium]